MRDRGTREHYEGLGAAGQGQVDGQVANRALRAADELACIDPQDQGKFLRQHVGAVQLGDGRGADIAHAVQIGQIGLHFTAEVVGHTRAELIVITAQKVVSHALAGGDIGNISIVNVDHRAAFNLGGARAVVFRLHLRRQPEHGAESGQVRFEQPRQDDAARVLPLLQRRGSLRGRKLCTAK